MIFSRSPFITRDMVSSTFPSGPYPIGFTLEDYLDLYLNVASLRFSILGIVTLLTTDDSGTVILTDPQSTSFSGSTSRRMKFIGALNDDGSELSNSQKPNTAMDYPIHLAGGGTSLLIIDFGKTLYYGGLYFPEISIEMSNGMTSTEVGDAIGSVTFGSYGSIAMYATEGFSAVCIGSISIRERYSSLLPLVKLVSPGEQITFYPYEDDFTTFVRDIDNIYLSGRRCDFDISTINTDQSSISITVPQGAKSGRFSFETESPFNYFRSEIIRVQ